MMPVRLRARRQHSQNALVTGFRLGFVCASVVALALAGPRPALAQHAEPGHGAEAQHAADAAHAEGEHEESLGSFLSRLGNFALLAGGLYYFLRKPLSDYLASRGDQISRDLVTAGELKSAATAQLAEIDQKLKALPAELDALRHRGAEEVKAEEARIRTEAERDRSRLLEQADREIAMRVQTARRDLTELAAELAVASATDRLKRETTDTDQLRLIDRYVAQVRTMHE